jgi:hypothetical protein
LKLRNRGGNEVSRVGFGFESGGLGQFDFLEEIISGRVRSIYRSLIDFDWIKDHLISGRIRSGSDSDQIGIGFGSDRISLI